VFFAYLGLTHGVKNVFLGGGKSFFHPILGLLAKIFFSFITLEPTFLYAVYEFVLKFYCMENAK